MKIHTNLDYPIIHANRSREVHLVTRLEAPKAEAKERAPISFSVVLDRSGSMSGSPLAKARKACEGIVKNLRAEDSFSLVIFDDEAEVVIPQGAIRDRAEAIRKIRSIRSRGCTNLTGGWMLGADELRTTPADGPRRLLLLSDGLLNQGITEPGQVRAIVAKGLEEDGIRTSCLGFGDHYDEELLTDLAQVTNGNYYDVDSEDVMPPIFAAELDGLRSLSAGNVRMRVKSVSACSGWEVLDELPKVSRPNGWIELGVGDLVSEEERSLVLSLKLAAIPHEEGAEGLEILETEFQWEDLTGEKPVSSLERLTCSVRTTLDEKEVARDPRTAEVLARQLAGRTMRRADELARAGATAEALGLLRERLEELKGWGDSEGVRESVNALARAIEEVTRWDERSRKSLRYRSKSYLKHSSSEVWSAMQEAAPSYKFKHLKDYQDDEL